MGKIRGEYAAPYTVARWKELCEKYVNGAMKIRAEEINEVIENVLEQGQEIEEEIEEEEEETPMEIEAESTTEEAPQLSIREIQNFFARFKKKKNVSDQTRKHAKALEFSILRDTVDSATRQSSLHSYFATK